MTDYTKPALRVNGIPIRCHAGGGGPTISLDAIAETTDRNQSGTLNRSRRGFKRTVSAKTTPYAWDDAANIADLVGGKAAALSYDQAVPFLLNGWLPGVVTGTGISQGVGNANLQFFYQPSGFSLQAAGSNYIQWSNLSGLLSGSRGLTITFMVRIPTSTTGFQCTYAVLSFSGGGDPGIIVAHDSTTGLSLQYGSVQTISSGSITTWAHDFHMVTAVIRDTTVTNYAAMSLYFDGALVASASLPGTVFGLNNRDVLQNGPSTDASNPVRLDEFVVYPFPLNDKQVAGLYQSLNANFASSIAPTSPTPYEQHQVTTPPRVLVSGDAVQDAFYAIGKVVGAASLPTFRDPVTGALANNGRTLDLQFLEV